MILRWKQSTKTALPKYIDSFLWRPWYEEPHPFVQQHLSCNWTHSVFIQWVTFGFRTAWWTLTERRKTAAAHSCQLEKKTSWGTYRQEAHPTAHANSSHSRALSFGILHRQIAHGYYHIYIFTTLNIKFEINVLSLWGILQDITLVWQIHSETNWSRLQRKTGTGVK